MPLFGWLAQNLLIPAGLELIKLYVDRKKERDAEWNKAELAAAKKEIVWLRAQLRAGSQRAAARLRVIDRQPTRGRASGAREKPDLSPLSGSADRRVRNATGG